MSKKKEIKEYNKLIAKHIKKKDVVKVMREVTDGEADIEGIILQYSEDFLLLHKEEEFRLNGYAIVRQDHYYAIQCDEADKTCKSILKAEGELKKLGLKKKISLDTWQSIFLDLAKQDYHVIIECEDLEDPTFTIGPIEKIGKKSVSVRFYDALGCYEKKATKLYYEDITLVKFGERYTEVFRKYVC